MKKITLGIILLISMFYNAQTRLIAHRGYWQTQPPTAENSIEALRNAQKLGLYGSEIDIRLTKDGVVIVNHDDDFMGMETSDTTFKDLRKKKLSNGEVLPTFEEYLKEALKVPSVKLIIELKPQKSKSKDKELIDKTLELVTKEKAEQISIFISSKLDICKEVKKLNSNLNVQYIKGELSPKQIKEAGLDGLDYRYDVYLKNPTWIAEAKKLGLITHSWTVDDLSVFKELKDQGIDFITTDTPAQLINE